MGWHEEEHVDNSTDPVIDDTNTTTVDDGNSTTNNETVPSPGDHNYIDPEATDQYIKCERFEPFLMILHEQRTRVKSGYLYEYGIHNFCYLDVVIESKECIDVKETRLDDEGNTIHVT